MINAILVPGRPDKDQHYNQNVPSNSENYWFSWLKRQLIIHDLKADAIEPPMPFRPSYDVWKKEFERFDITPDTILIGHSCGGGFLIRWLSENNISVGKVLLVAPWINPDNNPESDTADFFTFTIDPDFPKRTAGVQIFISEDDGAEVVTTVEILKDSVPDIRIHEFEHRGHFTEKSFPELLQEIV